jgi:hypothetical protein
VLEIVFESILNSTLLAISTEIDRCQFENGNYDLLQSDPIFKKAFAVLIYARAVNWHLFSCT